MPLAPLPANNTNRAWLKYTMYGVEHEMQFRMNSSGGSSAIQTAANTLAAALKALMPTTDSFQSLRYSVAGSIVSFPLAFTPVAGTGSAPSENQDKAKFISLVGRSAAGYRCRVTFFAQGVNDNIGYRVAPGVDAGCTIFYNAVTSLSPVLVAVDEAGVIWNGYINIGYNAYWQRQQR